MENASFRMGYIPSWLEPLREFSNKFAVLEKSDKSVRRMQKTARTDIKIDILKSTCVKHYFFNIKMWEIFK